MRPTAALSSAVRHRVPGRSVRPGAVGARSLGEAAVPLGETTVPSGDVAVRGGESPAVRPALAGGCGEAPAVPSPVPQEVSVPSTTSAPVTEATAYRALFAMAHPVSHLVDQ
jgi:hypothetical protein